MLGPLGLDHRLVLVQHHELEFEQEVHVVVGGREVGADVPEVAAGRRTGGGGDHVQGVALAVGERPHQRDGAGHGELVPVAHRHGVVVYSQHLLHAVDVGLHEHLVEPQGAVLPPHVVALYLGLVPGAEDVLVHEREVGEVHEVLQAPGRAGGPVVAGRREPSHGRVVPLRYARRVAPRVVGQADPDHAGTLTALVADQPQLEHPVELGAGRDRHQAALHVVGPAVVGAVDAPVLDPSQRRRGALVAAHVHEGSDPAVVADDQDALPQQPTGCHLVLGHVFGVGDRMPEVPHRPVPPRIPLGNERIDSLACLESRQRSSLVLWFLCVVSLVSLVVLVRVVLLCRPRREPRNTIPVD